MLSIEPTVNRRQFVGLAATAAVGSGVNQPIEREVALAERDWNVVLDFVRKWLVEIAEFDPEDAEYIAVNEAVYTIERQLAKT
jgi:hypothetical protein